MNSIRFVPTAVHGVFDYVGAIGLIASPFLFGFSGMGGIAVICPSFSVPGSCSIVF
jgi:hypothetical protein